MQVNNVLVEDISIDPEKNEGKLSAILYEFRDPKWVSVHWNRSGTNLGPITLLDDYQNDLKILENFSVTEFEEKEIPTEHGHKLVISHHDTWTIPPWTIYVLVLPPGFIATHILGRIQTSDWNPELKIASSQDCRIFYYAILGEADHQFIYQIELRAEENQRKFQKMLESSKVVEGKNRFKALRRTVTQEALSPSFWLKLLELAGKLKQ